MGMVPTLNQNRESGHAETKSLAHWEAATAMKTNRTKSEMRTT
jgi:hypothetical protein